MKCLEIAIFQDFVPNTPELLSDPQHPAVRATRVDEPPSYGPAIDVAKYYLPWIFKVRKISLFIWTILCKKFTIEQTKHVWANMYTGRPRRRISPLGSGELKSTKYTSDQNKSKFASQGWIGVHALQSAQSKEGG